MGKRIVGFWNLLTRLRPTGCRGESILILLPSCLQNSECRQKITNSVEECTGCGRCKTSAIIELARRYGCHVAVATGGRLAMELAKQDQIRAIVAVACEKELQQGLKGVFPKPALGIINIRPNGPCKDTDVNLEEIEKAINYFIRKR